MRIAITIDTANAAFDDSPETEVSYLLHGVAGAMLINGVRETSHAILDTNGNTVGRVEVTDDA